MKISKKLLFLTIITSLQTIVLYSLNNPAIATTTATSQSIAQKKSMISLFIKNKLNNLAEKINNAYLEGHAKITLYETSDLHSLNEQLNKLLSTYITINKTKNMTNTDEIMNSEEIGTFVNAYNTLIASIENASQLPETLDENDINKMNNQSILGAVLFMPEISIADFNQILSSRFALAAAAKNVRNYYSCQSLINNANEFFDKLTITSKDLLSSFGFADENDIANKAIIDNACADQSKN